MSRLRTEEQKQRNRERSAEWRRKYPERFKEGLRRHYHEHRDERLAYHRELYNKLRPKRLLVDARRRAKQLGVAFNLTLDDIVIPDICPVLGIAIHMETAGNGCHNPHSPSIDRLIPDMGYTKGNVHVISWRANALKNNAELWELKRIVEYIERFSK